MSIKITFGSDNGTAAPLYKVYPQQCQAQPAYLEFDPAADALALEADYSGKIGNAVPVNVWSGLIQRFSVSPCVLRSEIEALADNEKLRGLLHRVRNGFRSDPYRGGMYTDDARDAIQEIELYLQGLDEAEVWDAGDWIEYSVGVDAAALHDSFEAYYASEEFGNNEPDTRVVEGDIKEAVARSLASEVEGRSDEKAHKVAQMLAAYDADEYGYLLEDFE